MKTEQKKQIVEQASQRFKQLLEFLSPNTDTLVEDDKDDNEKGDNAENQPQNDNSASDLNADQPMDQQMQGNDMGAIDPNAQQQGQGGDLTSNFNPQGSDADLSPEMLGDDETTAQVGDEVVDVTELTDAQKEAQEELSQFNSKFSDAIKAIDSLKDMIAKNDEKIDHLNAEIKRRNPTPIEKMSNRASNAYPFSETPTEYWDKKEKTSNYSTEDDNNGKEDERYTITVGDVNNATDWKTISDSISDDFLYNQTLDKLMKM